MFPTSAFLTTEELSCKHWVTHASFVLNRKLGILHFLGFGDPTQYPGSTL